MPSVLYAEVKITDAEIAIVEEDPVDSNFHVVTTKDNQRFRIPKDMKLKKQGNVYLLETMESYVSGRNLETRKELASINERITRIEEVLGLPPLEQGAEANNASLPSREGEPVV